VVDDIREIFKRKLVPIRFQRTIGLFGATTLGIGALMGAGIYVLIGLAAGRAGPSAWLSYLLCGLLSLLSVFMFGELARRMPVAGGGYAYVYNTLGSFGGFLVGWLLAVGSVFACAMYATGFAYYFASLLPGQTSPLGMKGSAAVVIALLTWLNGHGTKGGENVQQVFTWGNLLVLLSLICLAIPHAEPRRLEPMFPNGVKGMGEAVAVIYVSFFGYQLIANNAEEIIEPTRTIPRAMLLSLVVSVTVYVALALISVAVVPWNILSKSNAPLVEVARKSAGLFGFFLVGVGGVLASVAALNSTLLSQARQIFAMGKHRLFPALLGRIHETYRTPVAALWAGGLVTATVVVFGELIFIVKAANFCFIVSLLPVSLALRKLYRSAGTNTLPPFWKRYLPEGALLANLALLFTLDGRSILFGLELTAAGGVIYFLHARKQELRARIGMSLVLTDERRAGVQRRESILVPMANPKTQTALFSVAEALLSKHGGEVVVLNVVEAPRQIDFQAALEEAEDALRTLERITPLQKGGQVKIRPVLRVSRSLAKGIVHAAEEERCRLIVMGYAGDESPQSIRLVEDVLSHARTDMILLKPKGEFAPKRIAVSLGGRINLNLMVRLAGAVADYFEGEIRFLNILPVNYTAEQKAHSSKILVEAIQHHAGKSLYHIDVLRSDEPLALLVEKSPEFDLLIAGAAKVGFLERVVVGPFSSQVAMRAQCSVAIVRVAPPVKKFLKL